jgi:streptogramin lyase
MLEGLDVPTGGTSPAKRYIRAAMLRAMDAALLVVAIGASACFSSGASPPQNGAALDSGLGDDGNVSTDAGGPSTNDATMDDGADAIEGSAAHEDAGDATTGAIEADASSDASGVDARVDAGAPDPCSTGGSKIYVADFGDSRVIRSDDMCGTNWTAFAGTTNDAGMSPLYRAQGITVDGAGKIYIADTFNNRIVRMDDMAGTNWIAFGASGAGVNQFSAPRSVYVDGGGHIFVTDSGNWRVVRIDDMTGSNWATFGGQGTGTGQFTLPWGLFVDGQGKIYVTDTDRSANHAAARLVRFDDLAGTNWTTFGAPGSGTNQLQGPWGVFVDGAGRIYIADNNNSRIVRIDDMSGTNFTAYGTLGQSTGQFLAPTGVSVDGMGRIYILDQGSTGLANANRVVRIDDMTGTNWTTLGTLGPGVKEFTEATGLWLH